MVGSFAPQPPEFSISGLGASPKPFHLITNAAALRLGHFLRRSLVSDRHVLGSILQSYSKIPHLGHALELNHMSHGGSHQFEWFKLPLWSHDGWATMFSSCMLFFGGEGNKTNFGDQEKAYLRTPMRGPVNRRRLTDMLLAINVLVYISQVASQGQVLMWGAKINGLIDKGELWRLVTSSFLHANVGHLMVRLIVILLIPLALPWSI